MYKIAFFNSKTYDEESFTSIQSKLNLKNTYELHFFEPQLSLETVSFAQGFHAICVFVNDKVTAEILAELDRFGIKLVCLRSAGFDRVDLRAADELDISVVRVPAYSPHAVAEFAATLLTALNRKVHKTYNRVRDSNFTLNGLVGFDINGKTVGVIGTGQIGFLFIKIMLGFGCNILCYDPFPNKILQETPNVKYVELDDLYANSHIISLHVPAMPETKHMINAKSINKMKEGVFIINTSRGILVDTKALIDGLVSQRIGGAALDVYENEESYFFCDYSNKTVDDEHLARLQNMRNVILTPHQSFLTEEALSAIATTTFFSLNEYFLENKRRDQLKNHVQPPKTNPAVARRLSQKNISSVFE